MRTVLACVTIASSALAGPAPSAPKPAPVPATAKLTPKPSGPVNLLEAVPTTIAVSSTVVNNTIIPDHIADGDLATAWNSKTGELVGAWIAFRVPADAKVTGVKLTAGFASIDKKLGDLFTMNPRIKKLRISHGKIVVEKALDIDNRGLQDIAIAGDGGDYKIEVLEIQPGSKAAWKETSVSELEVWGTPGPSAKPNARVKPIVRIGSLDPPPALPDIECVRALFPTAKGNRIDKGDTVVAVESIALAAANTYVCRVEHTTDDAEVHAVDIAVVRGGKQTHYVAAEERVTGRTLKHEEPDAMTSTDNTVTVDTFVLTPTETAVTVAIAESRSGPMLGDNHTKTTLYRATKAGLVEVLAFESTYSGGESSDGDRCELQLGAARAATLPDLDLHCTKEEGRWHGEDPRGNGLFTEERVEHFRWDGTTYVGR